MFLAALLMLQLQALAQYWQQEVDYTINVTLNDKDKSLEAFEKIVYVNHSPDTLRFIWFHLWPNAYKNDKTAFSEQLLDNNNTAFYFSKEDEKGYINRLDFKVDGTTAVMESHPEHIDIVKLVLPSPLLPGKSVLITTPFHVKLPKNFSRGGYVGETFQVTQWYPKPAVYDSKGWHPMPYLDQGEFYSEFGKFDVTVTIPSNYLVAATGELQNADELQMLRTLGKQKISEQDNYKLFHAELRSKARKQLKQFYDVMPPSSAQTKTLRYIQDSVHDFAWFASKLFVVQHDTIRLPSKTVDAFAFFHPWEEKNWNESISYIKDGITRYSSWLGDYPYSIATAVSGDENEVSGGMEYPTITLITLAEGGQELDITIVHELGHNWFYGVLASNERKHAWLDEGMNTYYQNRYEKEKYGNYSLVETTAGMLSRNKTPDDALESLLHAMFRMYRDQPIETPADEFSFSNYGMIVYMKASIWMKKLEDELGTPMFDSVMRAYFREWGFRHPYPEDFKNTVEKHSGKSIEPLYNLLFKTGPLSIPQKKSPKLNAFFPLNGTTRHQFISVLPALGVNMYDKLMLGAMVHNYQLPLSRVRFMAAPLYATGSKKLNGIGQLSFHQYSPGKINEWSLGINGATFSTNQGVDSNGAKVFSGVSRLVPAFRLHLKNRDYRSLAHTWLDLKSFIITEQGFNYVVKQSEGISYPEEGARKTRYVNQLSLNSENHRALYPYRYQLQLQQGKEFLRAAATLHYFFNYAVGGGMNMRVAAVKFGYIGGKTPAKEANTLNYQPKLTAVRGNEDYTYSNYFVGRNEFEGAASQQIMERDGNLKIRTDIFQDLQGRSDDWIAAVNLSTTIPKKLLPIPVPLKVFADAGTYADAWKKEASVSRFLYVAGLQLSLFHDLLNVYAPLIYSREFSNSLKTVPEENKLLRKISFSINIQNFSLRKIAPDLPL